MFDAPCVLRQKRVMSIIDHRRNIYLNKEERHHEIIDYIYLKLRIA